MHAGEEYRSREIERLRTELADLRKENGKLRGLECDRPPSGDRCGCPERSYGPDDLPLFNPLSACLLIIAVLQLAAAMTMAALK